MRKGLGLAGVGLAVVVALFALLHEAPVAAAGGDVEGPETAPAAPGAPATPAARSTPATQAAPSEVEPKAANESAGRTDAAAPPRGTASPTPVRGLVMRDDEASRSPGAVEQNQLSRAAIQNAIESVTPKIKDCYEQALKIEPTLAGTVKVNFTLAGGDDGKGVVTEGEIADSETKSPFFEACVLKEVAGAKFDAPDGGGTVKVTYPFKFASE